ncbi:MAG: hypothetical protein GVY28_11900 [Alphaproteobacteria bacterium]|jgi:hypothetical protein|nr:hypothetical protein [Alphaproteobacteria bacterium]
MYAKLVTLTVLALVLAAALLCLRHERLAVAHDLAELDARSRRTQQQIWQAQAAAAAVTTPRALHRRLGAARLALEPAVPRLGPRAEHRLADAHDRRRHADPRDLP